MCDRHQAAADGASPRRRRLWDLGHACHCPLIGTGLPLGALRKLVGKVTGGTVMADDYEVHVGVVSECGTRNRLSEAVQKELDRRYAPVLLRFRQARSSEQLAQLWQAAVAGGAEVPGAFWAALTHVRCTAALEEKMCRDLHMIQHQAGACARADIHRFHAVLDEKAQLEQEMARLRQRSAAMQLERREEQERHAAQAMQLRAQLVGRDSMIDSLRQELEHLRASIPGLASRERLQQQLALSLDREHGLRQQVAELKRELADAAAAARAAESIASAESSEPPPAAAPLLPQLAERSVLCVGGRNGSVAGYRMLVERSGAQFAHHDGGLEDNAGRLESSLAAADLVICQTGCISHSAYWRVKDFCKRTGKRCVFVDNPSLSSLQRGLEELA
ncbi:DUF2325 domain-containing protein [Massilia endophytica]|uniref:DUF2325 domain-containing protein n=1 Tax=Massilia endophytica TaxID=2899220 RepID=UPI001E53F9B1|nr:DUF2325 domain-containing protein [Massilia endophytica]UGQ45045.1 DUF2325 domain-containing protein [Massilia endophytica]